MDIKDNNRQYPPFYEKMVPVVLGIVGVLVVILLLIILGVGFDLL